MNDFFKLVLIAAVGYGGYQYWQSKQVKKPKGPAYYAAMPPAPRQAPKNGPIVTSGPVAAPKATSALNGNGKKTAYTGGQGKVILPGSGAAPKAGSDLKGRPKPFTKSSGGNSYTIIGDVKIGSNAKRNALSNSSTQTITDPTKVTYYKNGQTETLDTNKLPKGTKIIPK